MNTEGLLRWIREREAIRLKRAGGEPPPWTDDPILREWKFCSVRREHDRVTRWIAANWREPHARDPDLWFAMTVARLFNLPETLAEIGYPAPWDAAKSGAALRRRRARGETFINAAYKVGTAGQKVDKIDYLVGVLDRLWSRRERLRPHADETLHQWWGRLKEEHGLGSFLAAQVVADMKYVEPLRSARDWMSFAAPGPGSQRGLNRVLRRPVDRGWKDDEWRFQLRKLHDAINLERMGLGDLHAQDLQNCLCEFEKYERTRLNEGKPKQRFTPSD